MSARWLIAALHVVGVGTVLVLLWAARHFYHDDSYISLRYAWNWLHGNGLVWNTGEHVEGYTNFLHIVLESALGAVGMDLVFASRLIGMLSYAALLAMIARHFGLPQFICSRDTSLSHVAAALGFWLVASAVPLVAWTFGGLETVLAVLLVMAGVLSTLHMLNHQASHHTAMAAGAAFALAMLTRPDTVLFAFISIAFLCLRSLRDRSRFTSIGLMVAVILLVQLPYQYWRLSYFGDWLPNTYYAKVYGIPREWLLAGGGFYLLFYWLMFPFLTLVVSVLALVMLCRGGMDMAEGYLLTLLYVGMAALVWVGGDHMPYMRMAAVFVPIAALLLHRFCSRLIAGGKGQWVRDLASAMLLFIPAQAGYLQEAGFSAGALSGQIVALYVQGFPTGSLIAVNPAGALPYLTPQHRYIDMLGLNDPVIAKRVVSEMIAEGQGAAGHYKGDGAYVLSRKPDYIIMGLNWGAPAEAPMFLSDVELAQNPQFKVEYEIVEVMLPVAKPLLSQLRSMVESESAAKQYRLQVNGAGQLRFIYYKRRL